MNNSLNPIRINPSQKPGNAAMEFVRHAMLAKLAQGPGTPSPMKAAPLVPPAPGPASGGMGLKGLQPIQPLQPLQRGRSGR